MCPSNDLPGERSRRAVVNAVLKVLAIAALAASAGAWAQAGAGAQAVPVAAAPAARPAGQEMVLPVRSQQVLAPGGAPVRVAVGDPSVADVRILAAASGRAPQVLVLGQRPGS